MARERSAKKDKPPKADPGAMAPAKLDASGASALEIIKRAAITESPSHVIALFGVLESRLSAGDVEILLQERASTMRYHWGQTDDYWMFRAAEPDPTGLGWIDFLVQKGADPFKAKGSEKTYDYTPSLFETLVATGHWSYAEHLVASCPDGAKRGGEAMARTPEPYFGRSDKKASATRAFMSGGARGLALAFKLGFDPNRAADDYPQSPWVFECETVEQLGAFMAAGADLGVKNKNGATLEEAWSARAPSKEREELLQTLRSQESRVALDPEAAARALAGMARAGGSWAEVKKAAKANGVDPLSVKTSEGDSLFAVAAGRANWPLAAALLDHGADPQAPCSLNGLPSAAWAILGVPGYETLTGKKPSAAALAKQEAAADKVFATLDFSWRGEDGERLMEAATEASVKGSSRLKSKPSYPGARRLIALEPLDACSPLWARFIRQELAPFQVIDAAVKRPGEPWMDSAQGSLMGWLWVQDLPQGYQKPGNDRFQEFLRDLKYAYPQKDSQTGSAERQEAHAKIFAPEQWSSALGNYWGAMRQCDTDGSEALTKRVKESMGFWAERARDAGVEPFEFESLSKALVEPWSSRGGLSSRADDALLEFALDLSAKFPQKAGVILLDLLACQTQPAISLGYRIWSRLSALKIKVDLPGSHPLLSESGVLQPALESHAVWRQIEEELLTRQTQRPSGPKMR